MNWFYVANDQPTGPVSEEDLKKLFAQGVLNPNSVIWNKSFGSNWKLYRDTELFDGPPQLNAYSIPTAIRGDVQDELTVRRIADYERISGILWILFGIIQICMIYTIIAGVWNVIAGISRISMSRSIRKRNAGVPAAFEGVGQLVVIGIINLVFGAVIGLIFVALDFYVRDKVLSNRHLFNGLSLPTPSSDLSAAFRA
jgi:GYF domain 2